MSTKIATPFGLALMLAIGVFATMLALGLFSGSDGFRTSKLSADVGGTHIAPTVTLASATAGATTQYTILATGAASALSVGDTITVTFNTSTTVPASIAAANTSLKAAALTGLPATADQLVTPSAVSVSGRAVTITVPDMDQPSVSNGQQGIAAGTGITIVFKQAAGITNPNLAKTVGAATPYTLTVHNSTDTDKQTSAAYAINRSVTFTPSTAARGATIDVTGKGFTANCSVCNIRLNPQNDTNVTAPTTGAAGSLTVFDGTGTIDVDGLFTGTVVTTSSTAGGLFIWVTDGAGASTPTTTKFVQKAGATPTVASVSPGGTVTVDLVDFNKPAATLVANLSTLVGTTAAANALTSVSAADADFPIRAGSTTSGDTTSLAPYKFVMPTTIPVGTHVVTIVDSASGLTALTATFNIDVISRVVVVTPNPAAIGQDITVSGTGFTKNGTIAVGNLTVTGGAVLNHVTTTDIITIDSAGSWNFATNLQTVEAFASRTSNAVTVTATDGTLTGASSGFNRTARALTLDPTTAAPGTSVNVIVTGMTVNDGENATTAEFTMTVSTGTLSGTVAFPINADGTGSGTITVPVAASVGTLTFTATDNAAALNAAANSVVATLATANRTATAVLTVAAGTVTVEPSVASTGTSVTVTGVNFPPNTTGSVLTFGGSNAIPAGGFTTDGIGSFTVITETPAATTGGSLSPGTKIIVVTVGSISGTTTSFTVPNPTIVLSPSSAAPEETVSVTGTGFNALTAATVVNIGTASAIPSPAPRATRNGDLNFTLDVPLLNPGVYTVVVTNASGFTATATFTALSSPAPVIAPEVSATVDVFADVIANEDNLVRVWRFTNSDQSWAFFDPRENFIEFSTLTESTGGDIVWVNVVQQQEFSGGTPSTLYPGWNLISIN